MLKNKIIECLILCLAAALIFVSCGKEGTTSRDKSGNEVLDADNKSPISVEYVNLPDNLSYISDIYVTDDDKLLVAGGIRYDDVNVDGVIWQSEGEGWRIVFSKRFVENDGYAEPLITLLEHGSALIEYNNWDLNELKELDTQCFYIPDFRTDASERIFKSNKNAGVTAMAAYSESGRGYALGYDKPISDVNLPNLYEINLSENKIEKRIENLTISSGKIMYFDGDYYINSGGVIYRYNEDKNKIELMTEWNGITIEHEAKKVIHQNDRTPYILFMDDGIIYINAESMKKYQADSVVEFELEGTEPFTEDYKIEDHFIKNDKIYLFYYERSTEESKVCILS